MKRIRKKDDKSIAFGTQLSDRFKTQKRNLCIAKLSIYAHRKASQILVLYVIVTIFGI